MKHLFLLIVLVVPGWASCQKIQGVYVGTILSERNALTLESDGNQVTGFLYMSEYERFSFAGAYNRPTLKGTLLLGGGKRILVEGSLKKNSLSLTAQDSTGVKINTLHKVSPKVNLDMADLFSDQYDMLLLGVWETFKRTDAIGNDITTSGTIISQFDLQGRGEGRVTGTPPIPANRSYTPGSIPSQNFRWEIKWNTHDGQLERTEDHAPPGSSRDLKVHAFVSYSIENDTLVTRSANSNVTYWRRK